MNDVKYRILMTLIYLICFIALVELRLKTVIGFLFYEKKSIKSIDLKDCEMKTIKRDVLVKTYSICVNTKGEMCVHNLDSKRIIVLNKDMNYQDEFDTTLKVSYIAFDPF